MLIVVTTAAILQLNARTFEPCAYTNLQGISSEKVYHKDEYNWYQSIKFVAKMERGYHFAGAILET